MELCITLILINIRSYIKSKKCGDALMGRGCYSEVSQEKIYLFGAGNNGKNIISFMGAENIIAFVDNSEAAIGECISGIDVISFAELSKRYKEEPVLITSVYYADKIEKQLLQNGITRVYKAPFIPENMLHVDKYTSNLLNQYQLGNIDRIFFYPSNPITVCVANSLVEKDYRGSVSFLDNKRELEELSKRVNTKNLFIVLEDGLEDVYGPNIISLLDLGFDQKLYEGLRRYRNIYKGQKCFIIGNGPSLKCEDLDVLWREKVTCFGCNGIHKIFAQTDWRPDYYFYGDTEAFRHNGCIQSGQKYFMSDLFRQLKLQYSNIEYFHHILRLSPNGYPLFSDDIVTGVSGGRTTTFVMLQFATYMGFADIYLLGVDFSWGEQGEKTHFCEGYVDPQYEMRIRENIMHRDELIKTYKSVQKYAQGHNIKIYNATRGGNLEVFERVDFDKLF